MNRPGDEVESTALGRSESELDDRPSFEALVEAFRRDLLALFPEEGTELFARLESTRIRREVPPEVETRPLEPPTERADNQPSTAWDGETRPSDSRSPFEAETLEATRTHDTTVHDGDETTDLREGGPSIRVRASDDPAVVSERLGDYELIRRLGQGGMGVVFEARQISLGRTVALKLLKTGHFSGGEELARFRNETLVVAHLQHPGILPILEVGDFGGRPFFTMPLMRGGSLSEHTARYGSDPRAAAALMVQIAEAVHHAHQRGILHRDLKPSNILLDEAGGPFVTDFGLAKWIDQDSEITRTGAILGTPAYMAPEQAKGEKDSITVATDVYGLGTVLYALLTGRGPFSGSTLAETLRRVREETPRSPRAVNPKVSDGLELICFKCLEKEPARRYASAVALVEDLRDWLADRPIKARPAGTFERLRLWCKRRPAQAALGAALAGSILIGGVAFLRQWARTRHELAAHSVVNRFFSTVLLGQGDPWGFLVKRNVSLEDALERAGAEVDTGFADHPEIEAVERLTIGNALHVLGRDDVAEPQLRRGIALLGDREDEHRDLLANSLGGLGLLLASRDETAEARPFLERCDRINRFYYGPRHEFTLISQVNLGYLLMRENRLQEAERLLSDALTAYAAGPSPDLDPGELPAIRRRLAAGESQAMSLLGAVYQKQGRLDEAEPLFRETLSSRLALLGDDHPRVTAARSDLAANLVTRKRFREALPILEQAAVVARRIQGRTHEGTLTVLVNLGSCLFELRKLAEADLILREAVDGLSKGRTDDHPLMASALTDLGKVAELSGKPEEAERLLRRVVEAVTRSKGAESLDTARARSRLAELLHNSGRETEALAELDAALPAMRRDLAPRSLERISAETTRGSILLELGRAAEAEPVLRESRDLRSVLLPEADWQRANALSLHGAALLGLGKTAEAEREITEGYRLLSRDPLAVPAYVRKARRRVAELQSALGRSGEARRDSDANPGARPMP